MIEAKPDQETQRAESGHSQEDESLATIDAIVSFEDAQSFLGSQRFMLDNKVNDKLVSKGIDLAPTFWDLWGWVQNGSLRLDPEMRKTAFEKLLTLCDYRSDDIEKLGTIYRMYEKDGKWDKVPWDEDGGLQSRYNKEIRKAWHR